jgi:hypothetical protein
MKKEEVVVPLLSVTQEANPAAVPASLSWSYRHQVIDRCQAALPHPLLPLHLHFIETQEDPAIEEARH